MSDNSAQGRGPTLSFKNTNARTHSVACFSLITYPYETDAMAALSETVAPHCDEFLFFVANRTSPARFNGYRVHDLDIVEDEWRQSSKQVNFLQKWSAILLESYEHYYSNDALDGGLELAAKQLEQREDRLSEIMRGRIYVPKESVLTAGEEERRLYAEVEGHEQAASGEDHVEDQMQSDLLPNVSTDEKSSNQRTPFLGEYVPFGVADDFEDSTSDEASKRKAATSSPARERDILAKQEVIFPRKTDFASEQEQVFYESRRNFHGTIPPGADHWQIVRRFPSDLSDLKTDSERMTLLNELEKAQKEYKFAKFKFEKHVEAITQIQGEYEEQESSSGSRPDAEPQNGLNNVKPAADSIDGTDEVFSEDRDEQRELQESGESSRTDLPRQPPTSSSIHSKLKFIPDWYCFLESDVYFIPENFKRYALLNNYDPWRQALFLGHVWLYGNILMGQVTEHNYGSCLSRRAYAKLAVKFQQLKLDELEEERILLEKAQRKVRGKLLEVKEFLENIETSKGQPEPAPVLREEMLSSSFWIKAEQERIWKSQEVGVEHVEGILPGEIFSERPARTATVPAGELQEEDDPVATDFVVASRQDERVRTGAGEDHDDAKKEVVQLLPLLEQQASTGGPAPTEKSRQQEDETSVEPSSTSILTFDVVLSQFHHLQKVYSDLQTRSPSLKDPELYLGRVRPSSANHFGTRRIPSHFQCLPWKPYEWHDSIGIVQACLFDIGVFSQNPQKVTDSLGRYYYAQALNRVRELSPPVKANDMTILAPRDVQEQYKMLKGMWVARVHENKICLAKRREKQMLRLLYLEKTAKVFVGQEFGDAQEVVEVDMQQVQADGRVDNKNDETMEDQQDLHVADDSAEGHHQTDEQMKREATTTIVSTLHADAHSLLYGQHYLAYGDTGGLDAETMARVAAQTAVTDFAASSQQHRNYNSRRQLTGMSDESKNGNRAGLNIKDSHFTDATAMENVQNLVTDSFAKTKILEKDSRMSEAKYGLVDEVVGEHYLDDDVVDQRTTTTQDSTRRATSARPSSSRHHLFSESELLELAEDGKLEAAVNTQDAENHARSTVPFSTLNAILKAYEEDQKPTFAYSEFPICFHGHRAKTLNQEVIVRNTGDNNRNAKRKKKKNFSMNYVHEVVRKGKKCPVYFCGSYEPKVWQLPAELLRGAQFGDLFPDMHFANSTFWSGKVMLYFGRRGRSVLHEKHNREPFFFGISHAGQELDSDPDPEFM
ncbi:unnamed protein product [Amoebophrya sp. A120]|nr:unnamed protein product [Amoebophrya sp. A120]|eukprot:GSA120T00005859001.1